MVNEQTNTPIRLYMFQSGILKCKKNNIHMNADPIPYEIPVPWFLITHPKGNVIIDGGNAVEVAHDPFKHWGEIANVYWPVMKPEEGVEAALQQIGISKESVRYVLQSHLHLDHTGAIGRFPSAIHVVQRNEYEYAFTPDWFAAGGYIRNDFDKPGLHWMFLDGKHTDDFDLYGDGTIRIFFTPGHSPGHQSFLITLPSGQKFLLTVDAAYTLEHWNEKSLPGFLASAVDTVRSVRKLHWIAEREEAKEVTGHDPDAWSSFLKAPLYYE
ncbi:MAG: N-acyl homoserine lactone hydrolase [Candidatus Carbobacillus altaicus]|uniref:N-acyl homoserine lactone hydrolase n=1 Tax=Candidatus Carbonibacillus altaicus TaxID=2163959 RepID=A0A2R6Y2A5_9BACL|nr:MAG: N-acyl homoserine lactone hydrolase [Candidatus Carbobacillus altaicus]